MSSDSEVWVTFSRKLVCSPSPSVCSLAERGEPGLEPALVSGEGKKPFVESHLLWFQMGGPNPYWP